MTLPKSIAQNHGLAAIGTIFLGRECAALNHRRTQQSEIIRRDANATDLFRKRLSSQVKVRSGVFVCRNILERLRLLPPDIEPGGRASIGWAVWRGEKEGNDAVRIGEGERLQQNGIDDGKNRGGSANAKRECCQRGCGEPRIFAQHSQRVPQIRWQDTHSPIFTLPSRRPTAGDPPSARRRTLLSVRRLNDGVFSNVCDRLAGRMEVVGCFN